MNLQQLRYLVALGDAPSLTTAAAQLGVTQPVLSRALRSLERELGATLFRVDGRRLVLTDEGLAVLASARTAVRAADRVRDAVRPPTDELVVVAMPRYQWLVARLLPRLAGLPLRVVGAGSPDEVLRTVAGSGGRAVGLGDLSSAKAGGLELVPAGRAEVVVISPPGTDLPPAVRAEDLVGLPFAAPAVDSDRRRAHGERLLAGRVLRAQVVAESRAVLLGAVLAGTCSTMDARCRAEPLEGVEVRSFDPPRYMELTAARVPGEPTPAIATFLAALADPPWH
jgi:DNA-binding transcriptional LysR family regulator